MEKVKFGKFKVSKMGVGTDTFQKLSVDAGARILVKSHKMGINLWDTSDDYASPPHVKEALKRVGRKNIVLATKISARSYRQAKVCLKLALQQLGTRYADIILLHAVDTEYDLNRRRDALRYLNEAKREGKVKMVGISTHTVKVAEDISRIKNVDVILAPVNETGNHVLGGTVVQMKKALKKCKDSGKAVYAMKVLGKGSIKNRKRAIDYVKKIPFIDVLLVGVETMKHLEEDVGYF